MVVDASVAVAVLKGEATAPRINRALASASSLTIASVTVTETILVALKAGRAISDVFALFSALGVEIVPVDKAQAVSAAEARHRYPIRFGDAFVYALAQARGLPVLTLDAEFAKTDADLVPLA